MATTGTTDLNGLFKEAYASSIENLIPECNKIIKEVKMTAPKQQLGNLYHQPVILRQEQGVTYSAPNNGAFALNAARSMAVKDAQVDAYQILIASALDYESRARSQGPNSFFDATALQVENTIASISKRLELSVLYGQTGLGLAASSVNTDATHTVVTVSTATWSTGIWAGMENSQVQFWKLDNTLVSSGADAIFTVDSVDPVNTALTVSGTATGITALDAALAATDANIYFNGARTGATTFQEMPGIDKIITNTGTLFNISASTYNLWKGNTYDAGAAALTRAKLNVAISFAVARGLDEDVNVYVNPRTWSNVVEAEATLRKYDSSYKSSGFENGAGSITLHSENGALNLISHTYVKQGEAFAFPIKRVKRLGTKDIAFTINGDDSDLYVFPLADAAGYGFRVYTGQSVFVETPARTIKITNIVNS